MIFWSNRVLLWNDVKQILLWDCQQFWIQHVPIWEHPLEYSILSISCMPVQKTTDDFWSNRTLSQHAKWTPSCHGYISISLYIIFIYIHISWKSTRKHFHAMECFQVFNLEPCHARVSKIVYLVRFRIFEPYQSSKNNIKQLKSIEKQWSMMEKRKKRTNYEKIEKHNEK